MTLEEIVTFITGKVDKRDAYSRELCATFVKSRYRMIYDCFTWKDAQITVSFAAGQTILDEVSPAFRYLLFPGEMDRIISISYAGRFLEPIDSNLLLQTDPGIFERDEEPLYYEEYTERTLVPEDIQRRIRLYPGQRTRTFPGIVDGDYDGAGIEILIVGKRSMIELGPNSIPVIRNIDNTLIAYALGDMLQRGRHYGKAKEIFEEAAAHLAALKELETVQSNRPRVSKILTVSGNSLAEMTDAVSALTAQFSQDALILIKDFLRRNYQTVYDACLWGESIVAAWVNSDSDSEGTQIVLPVYFDRVIAIRADSQLGALYPADTSLYFGIAPGIFEQSGSPVAFSMLTSVGVAVLPMEAERLEISVDSPLDAGKKMFIFGESRGIEKQEIIELAGDRPNNHVTTSNQYQVPLTLSKPITAGTVSIYGRNSGDFLQQLLPHERERKHIRLWLQPNVAKNQKCLCLGKRRIQPLQSDEDTPLLRNIGNVLVNAAAADMCLKLGNEKGEATFRAKAEAGLKTLVDLETTQGAKQSRIIPYVEGSYAFDDELWLAEAK